MTDGRDGVGVCSTTGSRRILELVAVVIVVFPVWGAWVVGVGVGVGGVVRVVVFEKGRTLSDGDGDGPARRLWIIVLIVHIDMWCEAVL
jgi:hypothetical protein